ncbi:deoxyuridine 5' [Solea senegalensis]|uniref:Deoxyuridine 5'-triphosphate nucleotidohydrolase n=1 Tax=Solea senegalensis TaxID=28829 RepID=A0AAV6Q718_SOLSE|nr:deoxyuridine 5' [Solea senegalensis]
MKRTLLSLRCLQPQCCVVLRDAACFLAREVHTQTLCLNKEGINASAVSPSKKARTETKTTDQKPVLRFAKLSEHATTPTRGSTKAAGYDLYSAYDYTIAPMDKAIVKTDIQIAVPHGCYGRVAPRSGLAVKHFIDVGAGVVDEDYRGNVGVVLFNFGKETFDGGLCSQLNIHPRFISLFINDHYCPHNGREWSLLQCNLPKLMCVLEKLKLPEEKSHSSEGK